MIERIQTTIRLEQKDIDSLTHYAKKIKVSRNRLLENMIEGGLEDLAILEKTGMLLVGVGIRDLMHKVRNADLEQSQQLMEF